MTKWNEIVLDHVSSVFGLIPNCFICRLLCLLTSTQDVKAVVWWCIYPEINSRTFPSRTAYCVCVPHGRVYWFPLRISPIHLYLINLICRTMLWLDVAVRASCRTGLPVTLESIRRLLTFFIFLITSSVRVHDSQPYVISVRVQMETICIDTLRGSREYINVFTPTGLSNIKKCKHLMT